MIKHVNEVRNYNFPIEWNDSFFNELVNGDINPLATAVIINMVEVISELVPDFKVNDEYGIQHMLIDFVGRRNDIIPKVSIIDGSNDFPDEDLICYLEQYNNTQIETFIDLIKNNAEVIKAIGSDKKPKYSSIDEYLSCITNECFIIANEQLSTVFNDHYGKSDVSLLVYKTVEHLNDTFKDDYDVHDDVIYQIYNHHGFQYLDIIPELINLYDSNRWRFIKDLGQSHIMVPVTYYHENMEKIDKIITGTVYVPDSDKLVTEYDTTLTRRMINAFRYVNPICFVPVNSFKEINKFTLLSGKSSNDMAFLTCINMDLLLMEYENRLT